VVWCDVVWCGRGVVLCCVQVIHLAVDARWERLGGFWDTMPLGKGSVFATPLSELCSAVTYSRIVRRRASRGEETRLPPAVSDFKATGIFAYFVPQKLNLEHPQSQAAERWDRWEKDSDFSEDSTMRPAGAEAGAGAGADVEGDSSRSKSAPVAYADWRAAVCPATGRYGSLRAGVTLPPIFPLQVPELPADYHTRNQRAAAMRSVVVPMAAALDKFGAERYAECAGEIGSLSAVLYRLGGTRVLRHSLQSAQIEAYLRAGMYRETKGMLSERVTLFEYDAQSWFQLSAVATQMQDDGLAEMAYMRAWQFGHRRAGTEGPISQR
jgi:hypothetical protein